MSTDVRGHYATQPNRTESVARESPRRLAANSTAEMYSFSEHKKIKRQIKSSEGGLKRRVVFAKGFVFKVFGEG